jgi:hypothetical protein
MDEMSRCKDLDEGLPPFAFRLNLEYHRIFKHGAPHLGLECVQERVKCVWEDDICFLPLTRTRLVASGLCVWLVDME